MTPSTSLKRIFKQLRIYATINATFYQDVEEKDQHEVWRDQPVDVPLLSDGGDEGGEAVMAHEGVDANAEQVWNAWKVGHWRVGSVSTCKSVESSIKTIVRDVKISKEMYVV